VYASYIDCVFPERIDFKLAVLVFKCLNGLAPSYISPANFIVCLTWRVDSGCARRRQRISYIVPRTSPLCNHRLPFPSHGCACMEHSSIKRDVIVEFGCFQVLIDNRVVHAMLRCSYYRHVLFTMYNCPFI